MIEYDRFRSLNFSLFFPPSKYLFFFPFFRFSIVEEEESVYGMVQPLVAAGQPQIWNDLVLPEEVVRAPNRFNPERRVMAMKRNKNQFRRAEPTISRKFVGSQIGKSNIINYSYYHII